MTRVLTLDDVAQAQAEKRLCYVEVDFQLNWMHNECGRPFDVEKFKSLFNDASALNDQFRFGGIPIIRVMFRCANLPRQVRMLARQLYYNKHDLTVSEAETIGSELEWVDLACNGYEDDHVVIKRRLSAFNGTGLAGHMRLMGWDTVMMSGFERGKCFPASVASSLHENFNTIVLADMIEGYKDAAPGKERREAECRALYEGVDWQAVHDLGDNITERTLPRTDAPPPPNLLISNSHDVLRCLAL